MIGRCPSCLAKFFIEDSKIAPQGVKVPCSMCGAMFSVTPPGSKAALAAPAEKVKYMVLVAHDSHAFCKEARRILEESPHNIKVVIAHDQEELLSSLESEPLNAVLVEMTFPGMFGFEVAAKIKKNDAMKHIKVILASSVYVPMGNKPASKSLYGADDYIEAHQLQDMLVDKVVRLVIREAPAATPKPVPNPQATSQTKAPKPDAKPAAPNPNTVDHQRAQRLARIIVNDIALYNQEVMEKGRKSGNILKLLEKDIKEGRDFYVKRVPEEIRSTTSYLEDELKALVETPAVVALPETDTVGSKSKQAALPKDSPEHKKAQRLARTIASDIGLYSQEAIQKGLQAGNVMKHLKRDLKEARDLYVKRVPEDIRLTTNYLGDELQALFDRKRQELRT